MEVIAWYESNGPLILNYNFSNKSHFVDYDSLLQKDLSLCIEIKMIHFVL